MQKLNIETLAHSLYTPDLAPCDFWLFPVLKDSLRGTRYENREELTQAMTGSWRVMSRDGLAHVFRAWESRMNKCIEYKGDYFEETVNIPSWFYNSNPIQVLVHVLSDYPSYMVKTLRNVLLLN